MTSASRVQRNLRLYPVYIGASSFFAWMPVFFLYFASRVTLAQVLALEAIYYASVVVLEVPSGYLSDRLGRRPTLILSASLLTLAYLVYMLAGTFAPLTVAQVLLAAGIAFNSGTDTSCHLATLEALGIAETYPAREARMSALSFMVGAVAALVGGLLALIDLRLPYAAALVGAVVALTAAIKLHEAEGSTTRAQSSLLGNVRESLSLARSRQLSWFFAAVVVATVVNHVPYEFYQPYIERLADPPWPTGGTPLIAGIHLAAVQLVAAAAARYSASAAGRIGTVTLVLVSMSLQVALVALMAFWVSPVVVVLLVGRSIPRAMMDAPLRAAVAPHVPPAQRATYLSLQSLVGRLGFALLLGALALGTHDISRALRVSTVVALVVFLLLAVRSTSAASRLAGSPSRVG